MDDHEILTALESLEHEIHNRPVPSRYEAEEERQKVALQLAVINLYRLWYHEFYS